MNMTQLTKLPPLLRILSYDARPYVIYDIPEGLSSDSFLVISKICFFWAISTKLSFV